jgi:hypothetical protein
VQNGLFSFLLSQNTSGRLNDARPTEKVAEAWIMVRLEDGQRYEGWPEFYSLGPDQSEIYLSPACAYGRSQKDKAYSDNMSAEK